MHTPGRHAGLHLDGFPKLPNIRLVVSAVASIASTDDRDLCYQPIISRGSCMLYVHLDASGMLILPHSNACYMHAAAHRSHSTA